MISTLVNDIQQLLSRKDGWFTDELAASFSTEVAKRLQMQFNEEKRTAKLRLSQMGPRCPRSLWYSIHHPEFAEPLPPWAEFKYCFGHIIEALAIALAKASGHEVTGEQDEVSVDGILGHRDCVIDGCIVDVKSSSSRGFIKFKDGSIRQDDSFGYLDQLDGYLLGSIDDPLVTVKDKGYLLAIDKQLGHMCLYEHQSDHIRRSNLRRTIANYRDIIARNSAPDCTCNTIADGKSGNIKLDTKASYNLFKHCCFPSLRTFLYASGPVFLTKVVRKPDVPEVNKFGQIIYS